MHDKIRFWSFKGLIWPLKNGKFSEQATHTRRKESYHMTKIIPEIKSESHNYGFAEYIKRINLFLEISCKTV